MLGALHEYFLQCIYGFVFVYMFMCLLWWFLDIRMTLLFVRLLGVLYRAPGILVLRLCVSVCD